MLRVEKGGRFKVWEKGTVKGGKGGGLRVKKREC